MNKSFYTYNYQNKFDLEMKIFKMSCLFSEMPKLNHY